MKTLDAHTQTIRQEFTKQAVAYSQSPVIADEARLAALVAFAEASPEDEVLDVASGPGLVSLAFAPQVKRVTGVDITPRMLERAEELKRERGVNNVEFRQGDIAALPFPPESFDLVVCRFAFHHFPDPAGVLREMVRVCRPSGRVVVADTLSSEDRMKAAYHNELEGYRDPSHARALSLSELRSLFPACGMPVVKEERGVLEMEFEEWARRTYQSEEHYRRTREMLFACLEEDKADLRVRLEGGAIHFTFHTVMLMGRHAGSR
jgi:ubiquinone/menaquinone biosynthesis C-methylase UbiE